MSDILENYSRKLLYVNILKNKYGDFSKLPSEIKRKRKSLLSRLINHKSDISRRNKIQILEELFNDRSDLKDYYLGLINQSKDKFSSNYYLPNKNSRDKFDEYLSHPIYHQIFNAFDTEFEKSQNDLNYSNLSSKLFNLVLLRLTFLGVVDLKDGLVERVVPSIESLNYNKTSNSQKRRVQRILRGLADVSQNNKGLKSRFILINRSKLKEIKDKLPLFTDKLFDRFYMSSGSETNILITFNRCSK